MDPVKTVAKVIDFGMETITDLMFGSKEEKITVTKEGGKTVINIPKNSKGEVVIKKD